MADEQRSVLVREQFIKKWAKRYVEIFNTHGKESAVAWGTKFFNSEDIPRIAEEAKKLLGKR